MNKTNMIIAVLSAALILMSASTIFLLANNTEEETQLTQYDVNLTIFSDNDSTEITLIIDEITKSFSFPIGTDFVTEDDRFDAVLSMIPDNITSIKGIYEIEVTIPDNSGPFAAFSGCYNIAVEVL